MMKFDFKNEAEQLSLKIYDYIGDDGWGGGITTDYIEEQLKEANNKPLFVYINSYGGEVFEGFAIYNILKRYAGQKTVIVDGIAASIASVIAMAGDKICMNTASMMMIHNASGVCIGNAEDMKKVVNALEQMNEVIRDVYQTKTNLDNDKLTELMDNETFMTAKECVDYGFADEILDNEVDSKAMENSLNLMKNSIEQKIKQFNDMNKISFETKTQEGSNPVLEEENVLNKKSHWNWLKNGGLD